MSNLENLRKQAKLYVRWHREVLEASFKLSDAQELVAHQHGFESWPRSRQECT